MDLVSIIVPIYNVEKYLEDCVKSILNQSYKNIEVLLIDDGSTDLSGQIIDRIAETDNRVGVFHLENGGVAKARNYGINHATGKYLAFADSDDIMTSQFIEKAVHVIKNADYVSCAFETINERNEGRLIDYMAAYGESVACSDYLKKMIEYQAGAYWGANWGKLYISEIIKNNQIQFEPNVNFAEDFRFNIRYLMCVHNISLIHEPVYYYRVDTSESLSKKTREPMKYWEEYHELYNRYQELYFFHGVSAEMQSGISKFLIGAYVEVLRECVYSGKMRLKEVTKICEFLDSNEDVQRAANMCIKLHGRVGKYAKLISRHYGKVIAVLMKTESIIKRK